ncbi:NAD kinase [Cryptosporangium aurantiacum]|uniref:NAD kinase n=1 Tax=Cryptosporangium aurantiacum TaxID=134849 RepID=A0A1M7RNX6_9ACTN|nr:NAD kinase [Cryptosporangium aurantiacum]SHN47850.1 NAD+ kinase [Cryptosporangium aurantiacum]
MSRQALLVTHAGRALNVVHARRVAAQLSEAGFGLRVLTDEAPDLNIDATVVRPDEKAAVGAEIVFALGGDGTLLRAAALARPAGAALLGINLGRVGFLAEAEAEHLDETVRRVVEGDYVVDERMTLDLTVGRPDGSIAHSWALNEASVEKAMRERMLEVMVSIDGRPLSRWGCDGVVCATPTGSTAYAFSAGGPVVWPDVEAMLVVPISAHALFARPLVTAPTSTIIVEVLSDGVPAVVSCDGQRVVQMPPGSRAVIRRGGDPVRVVRMSPRPFTDRLVAKFGLPVQGWRGDAEAARSGRGATDVGGAG